jgi:exosortase E/protease (VPEID-CTERM system)
VNQIPSPLTNLLNPRLGLAARVTLLGLIFFLEKIFLNGFVDFDRAQVATGLGAIVRDTQHWAFRFLVALMAAAALFAYVLGDDKLKLADTAIRSTRVRVKWAFAHALLVACLIPLTYALYRDGATSLPLSLTVTLGIAIGACAALSAFLAMSPLRLWYQLAAALGSTWWYAVITALVSASAMQLSQRLWEHTATLTFDLVRRVLVPFIPTLSADSTTRVLRTGRFAIEVSDICSGLEGVGLMLAFAGAWLLYFRHEYRFPRALLLIPVSIAAIFALNVVRIAVLMLIGDAGFPDVAQYGFHSQAGWIAFNAVACGLVLFSRKSAWLYRESPPSAASSATYNPTAAYLMPLLAILAAAAVTHALSSDFEYLYPLRAAAGLGMLLAYRQRLAALDWHWSWRGPVFGAMVFLLWIGVAHFQLTLAAIPSKLAALPPSLRSVWIISRLAGGVLIVPIAEELAYRGYLMRRLTNADFDAVRFQSVRWPALAATAILFGFAHGALWLPGIAAGVVFGLLIMRRGQIGEAVVAHATSNALIAASVLGWNQWQLW